MGGALKYQVPSGEVKYWTFFPIFDKFLAKGQRIENVKNYRRKQFSFVWIRPLGIALWSLRVEKSNIGPRHKY